MHGTRLEDPSKGYHALNTFTGSQVQLADGPHQFLIG